MAHFICLTPKVGYFLKTAFCNDGKHRSTTQASLRYFTIPPRQRKLILESEGEKTTEREWAVGIRVHFTHSSQ